MEECYLTEWGVVSFEIVNDEQVEISFYDVEIDINVWIPSSKAPKDVKKEVKEIVKRIVTSSEMHGAHPDSLAVTIWHALETAKYDVDEEFFESGIRYS